MKAVKDTLHNLGTSMARYPLMLISSIIVTRFLGPENKGIYVYLIMISNVILPISFIGFGNGIQYYISNKTFKVKNVFVSSLLIGFLTGLFVSILIYFLWSMDLLGESGNATEFKILLPFLISIPIDGILYVSRFLFLGDSKFQINNNITLIMAVTSAIVLVLFVLFFSDKLLAAAIALNTVKILYLSVILFFMYRIYAPIRKFNFTYLKKTYVYGAKSWLGNISARANDSLDVLIIGMFVSPEKLGIYSVSYALVNLLLIPSNAVSPVLFNKISQVNSLEKSSVIAAQIHRSLFLFIAILAIGLGIAGYWLIPLMYGDEFMDAYIPFLILIPGILIYSVSRRVLQKLLSANGFPLKTSMIQLIAAVVGSISYIILIPKYGIIGGAIGSSIAYFTSMIVAYFITVKELKKHFNFFSFSINDIVWVQRRLTELLKIKFKS